MNIGKDNKHPKYVCDKCKNIIYYEPKKGYVGLNKYYKQKPALDYPKKSFDLCDTCERKFREWLNIKEIFKANELFVNFPRYYS